MTGLLLISPLLWSSGCADKAATCPPARPAIPPAILLQEVPEPVFRGKTNSDLLNYAVSLRQALRLANSDKAALREWVSEAEAPD